METKANLLNSVNLPTMKIKFRHKISFNPWSLFSIQEKHICRDTKVI